MNDELKACPFCGKETAEVECDGAFWWVKCQSCGASGHVYWFILNNGNARDIVIDNWNTRPIEDALRLRIAELEAELKITDELLKEATETIGAVVACCTYNSNDDAKIGIYGIDQKAFTRIDQFITHYNDAVSAGKVSVDVKPVQRPADPSLEEDE